MKRRICLVLALTGAIGMAGCGGKAGASKPVRPRKQAATATSAPVAQATSTAQPEVPTSTFVPPTATAAPTAATVPTHVPPTSAPAAQPPVLVYAELRPDTVQPGGTLRGSVQTRGSVSRVQMYLGSGIPSAVGPSAVDLNPDSPGVWTGTITAPTAPGQYHFTVGIFDTAGHRNVIDNDGWNVTVAGSGASSAPTVSSGGVQALPDNIPLAPAFAWGNPTATTFTAEGKTINGSEVASNSRPDVPASDVVTFYTTRLPRSGWAVDPGTIPAQGATSFTMVGTSGNQVCVVQYGGSAIQIFYGNL